MSPDGVKSYLWSTMGHLRLSRNSVLSLIDLPSSYGIHPILNIAHLEKYQSSPAEFGERPSKSLNQEDFNKMPEYEVEQIITEWKKKGKNGTRIIQYLTWFKGYLANSDEWLSPNQLKNTPDILEQWKRDKKQSGPHLR